MATRISVGVSTVTFSGPSLKPVVVAVVVVVAAVVVVAVVVYF